MGAWGRYWGRVRGGTRAGRDALGEDTGAGEGTLGRCEGRVGPGRGDAGAGQEAGGGRSLGRTGTPGQGGTPGRTRGRTGASEQAPGHPCEVLATQDGDTSHPQPPPPPQARRGSQRWVPTDAQSRSAGQWYRGGSPALPAPGGLPAALPCAAGAGYHRRPPAPGRRRPSRGAPEPPPHPPPPPSAGAVAAAAGSWPGRGARRAAISARGGGASTEHALEHAPSGKPRPF